MGSLLGKGGVLVGLLLNSVSAFGREYNINKKKSKPP